MNNKNDAIQDDVIPQTSEGEAERQPRSQHLRGLSTKLLALTVLFVMLGEVLIFVPSIANFRMTWLADRLAVADVASLVIDAAPDKMVPKKLRDEILERAGAKTIAVKHGGKRTLMLQPDTPISVDQHFDLRTTTSFQNIVDSFGVLFAGKDRMIRVVGHAPKGAGDYTDIVIEEAPLRAAMIGYSTNILTLSIILSLLVAACVFFVLNFILIRPIRRMTLNMLRFSERPQDASRVIQPSKRLDEIGIAERELQNMQTELAGALQQQSRLAALGLAVSKISHDMRNMLASAQLISDRLILIDDPTVKKFAPKLIMSLDRAIDFCAQTLKYGRAQEPPPRRDKFFLRMIADDAIDATAPHTLSTILLFNDVKREVKIDADRDHIFRILTNLMRNAIETLDAEAKVKPGHNGEVHINAWREGANVTIEVADNGPGVSKKVQKRLFEAFQGSAKSGGTGLGLAISAELARAHGGSVELHEDGLSGKDNWTRFWVSIPDQEQTSNAGRRGELAAG